MTTYCKHLNIQFDPLEDMSWIDTLPKDRYVKYSIDSDKASEEMKAFLQHNNLPLYDIEVFCCPPNYTMPPHCDDAYFGDYAKINFAFSEQSHTMDWYEPTEKWNAVERTIYTSYANQPSIENPAHYWFKFDEVDKVHSEKIEVAQVNVGIPHGVTTTSHRVCISFIPFTADGKEMTMDYVLQTP